MELRQKMFLKIRLRNFRIFILLIVLTDFCRLPKLTDASKVPPDSRTAGSRESRFQSENKRQSISEDEEAIWNRRRERSAIEDPSKPVEITQQEERHSLPKFFPTAVVGNGAYGSNMGSISNFYSEPSKVSDSLTTGQLSALTASSSKTGSSYGNEGASYFMEAPGNTPEMQSWQGNMPGFGTAQMPQELNNVYSGGASAGYGALPNAGIGGTPSPYAGYLEKQINSYPIMLYTLNDCIPCQRAKHMLALSYPDVHAHFLELSGNEPWQQQLQIDLQYLTGAITFPYIFVCGQYIGGASDLFEWHESGQLRRALSQCIKPTPTTKLA